MSSRLINPYQEFRDASGEVVNAGTLTFYVNGDVNTQKNIYSDADLTTTQSNPYTLDAYGRVIGDIWLDGEYSVVLKDSDGNTIRTMNDVESFSSASGGGGGETVQGSVQNKFVNGACRVASEGGSVSISGSYQEGQVAEINVKAAGTPTNGTIDLTKYANCGTSGYTLHVNQLTTGGGGTVDYRFRFNSVDSRDLVDGAAIFQCNVLQNTGAAKTYTISIYKANAEDNFSGTTLIGQSSGTSVSDSTDTKISFSIADMGACENGIEIILSCACGAVTTKDFYINDIVFRKGQAEIVFEQNPYDQDYASLKFGTQDANIDTLLQVYRAPKNYISDKNPLSIAVDTDHDITIAALDCSDSTNVYSFATSAITKQIDATWAEGNNLGGCSNAADSGAVQANTYYGVFVLSKPTALTTSDAIFAKTKANALADSNVVAAGFTICRLVGYVLTDGSSNIIAFINDGDGNILWDVIVDETISTSATRVALTVQVPPFQIGRFAAHLEGSGGAPVYQLFTRIGQTDTTPSATAYDLFFAAAGDAASAHFDMKVDGSKQIYHRESAATATQIALMTRGYKMDYSIQDLV